MRRHHLLLKPGSRLCVQPAGGVCERARDAGLIVITAGKGDVVRLVPPLIVSDADVDQAVKVLAEVISAELH